jgi:hypothetical protein
MTVVATGMIPANRPGKERSMYEMRRLTRVVGLLLVAGLMVPPTVGADGRSSKGSYERDDKHHDQHRGKDHDDDDDDDDHDDDGRGHGKPRKKGGVCSPRPRGCEKEDCRCEDHKTCVRCREFVCRRGKKKRPFVICRPCCRKKNGYVSCEPAPKSYDIECVASPS